MFRKSRRNARWVFQVTLMFAAAVSAPVAAWAWMPWDGVGSVPVVIEIPDVVATPGELAQFEVLLHAGDNLVAGFQNDTGFDADVAIGARADGRPDCAVNPDINKPATAFAFQPSGCNPAVDCEAVRAIVISIADTEPIADGSVVYTCALDIAPEAAGGAYAFAFSKMIASTRHGQRLEVVAEGGEILVVGADEGERALGLDGGADAGEDGCHIGATRAHGLAWVLLLPAALVPWRRRRK